MSSFPKADGLTSFCTHFVVHVGLVVLTGICFITLVGCKLEGPGPSRVTICLFLGGLEAPLATKLKSFGNIFSFSRGSTFSSCRDGHTFLKTFTSLTFC
ncbi:hypothetical protein GDO81_024412 [Engystomops pustulosus]|uniref:Uncharacterized protein n=1 Tax=Engystomops pustulosus TaxID=76066 RepID=A0AAV6YP69_ENGPU|nr:hypothetical protein GDO81_024412 [Engystomops pustulosus]